MRIRIQEVSHSAAPDPRHCIKSKLISYYSIYSRIFSGRGRDYFTTVWFRLSTKYSPLIRFEWKNWLYKKRSFVMPGSRPLGSCRRGMRGDPWSSRWDHSPRCRDGKHSGSKRSNWSCTFQYAENLPSFMFLLITVNLIINTLTEYLNYLLSLIWSNLKNVISVTVPTQQFFVNYCDLRKLKRERLMFVLQSRRLRTRTKLALLAFSALKDLKISWKYRKYQQKTNFFKLPDARWHTAS